MRMIYLFLGLLSISGAFGTEIKQEESVSNIDYVVLKNGETLTKEEYLIFFSNIPLNNSQSSSLASDEITFFKEKLSHEIGQIHLKDGTILKDSGAGGGDG